MTTTAVTAVAANGGPAGAVCFWAERALEAFETPYLRVFQEPASMDFQAVLRAQ